MLYKSYKQFLKEIFPTYSTVRKIPLNAGFGCPNLDGAVGTKGCSYCDNHSFSPVASKNIPCMKQLEQGIRSLRNAKNKNIREAGVLAYFQSYTNTYAAVEKLREVFMPVVTCSEVAGISVGTRPDCLPQDTVNFLAEIKSIKPVIVEIGVQSANDLTLQKINRGHTVRQTIEAARLCKSVGLIITAHIIIGLPGETLPDFLKTAELVAELGFSAVKIHPLHIIKGTQLAEEYARKEFSLLSFDDYCRALARVIKVLSPSIAIERISGEAPTEMLIAPEWSGDRERIAAAMLAELSVNGTL